MGAKGLKLTGALLLIVLSMSLSSCFHLYFDRVQPKGGVELTSVPEELQGQWFLRHSINESKSDSIYIDQNGWFTYDYDSIKNEYIREGLNLSDTLRLFKAGEYYVANYSEDRMWWEVEIIHRHENGDIYFYYPSEAPYFGKRLGLRVVEINEAYREWEEEIMEYVETEKRPRKRLKMGSDVFQRNAVYYSGQFRVKDISKVMIEKNLVQIYRVDGSIERPNQPSPYPDSTDIE